MAARSHDSALDGPENVRATFDDLAARIIASEWHGGQGSALLALATSGAIGEEAAGLEIAACLRETVVRYNAGETEVEGEMDRLIDLWLYVIRSGERGPVAGWSGLSW